MEYEKFMDNIKEINGVLYVSIPYKIAQFSALKKGDSVKVMIQKVVDDETI